MQLSRWFERHRPAPGGERFVYLTHAWLLDLFLDCPASIGVVCPTAEEASELEAAIRKGWVTWHAAPWNPNYEMMDADALAFSLGIARRLDARFGLPAKRAVSLVR